MSVTPLRQTRPGIEPIGKAFPIPLTMAFQPIIDAEAGRLFAYEALVRGRSGEGAGQVLAAVDRGNRRQFDQQCRLTALELAAGLGLRETEAALSINFMPNAIQDAAASARLARDASDRLEVDPALVIFEFTESEPVEDQAHLGAVIRAYREMGFRTAIDDFGAGYSGLALLADFQPDIVKLDMALVRGIGADQVRRTIVASILRMCGDLGVVVVAEGIEAMEEYAALRTLGVSLFQGYLFARPEVEALPLPVWPRPG